MTTTENDVAQLTQALENAARENHSLRDTIEAQAAQIAALQNRQETPGAITDHALCKGCYRWRLVFSMIVGTILAFIAMGMLYKNEPALIRFAGSARRADVLESVIALATLYAPLITAKIEWRWKLYRAGYPGVFGAIAEMWAGFKKGLGVK